MMQDNTLGYGVRSRLLTLVISSILIISVFPASAVTVLSENFEGNFPADNGWSVGDLDGSNDLDYWGSTSFQRKEGSFSGWSAQIGSQTAPVAETIFSEDFEGTFTDGYNGWSIGDSSCQGNYDYWDDTASAAHNGSWSAWVADIGRHDEEVYGNNNANVNIPDNDGTVYSGIKLTGAPTGKKISTMDVYFDIKHTYVGDLYVDIADENADYSYVLWNRQGGSQDNIQKRENCISKFNDREYVNQVWKLRATDKAYWDTGYIDYWSISAYYDAGTNNQYREYDNYMDSYMRRTVDLRGYSSPKLTFYYTMPSVETGYDYGQVKINGVEIKRYTAAKTDWTPPETIDLGAYARQTITIEWNFHSDYSVRKEGWYVDDITITGAKTTSKPNSDLHQYDDYMDAYMTKQINLKGYSSAILTYNYWLDVERGYDYLKVQTSSDGVNWIDKKAYSEGYDSKDSRDLYDRTWLSDSVDLNSYAGSSIYIRFLFHSDLSIHDREGAYLDNIKVDAVSSLPDLSISGEDITFEKVG